MKKLLFSLFLLLIFSTLINAQNYQVKLEVNQNISELDFGAFLIANNLSGAPRFFSVIITPEEGQVKLKGDLYWKKNINSSFEKLYSFQTKKFTARTVFNTDLGTTIKLEKSFSNGDLIEENRKRGKPTGEYKIEVALINLEGTVIPGTITDDILTFENPAQTLTILSPKKGSLQNVGGVLAEWSNLTGIDHYEIKANTRDDPSESLEEALSKGEPLIDNANVGLATSVDLRTLLSREWLPGEEIIFQVAAVPEGSSEKLYSQIINFYLDDPQNPQTDRLSNGLVDILQQLSGQFGNDLLDKLLSGEIKITDIVWEDTGISLTPNEIQQLLNYLSQNPNDLIDIKKD